MHNRKLMGTLLILALGLAGTPARDGFGWGEEGHRYICMAAVEKLPSNMPAFFKKASGRLSFLVLEPDRWRDSREIYPALRTVNNPDHYLDIDNPENFTALPNDRFQYSAQLRARGLNADEIGFLPYAALEAFQKMSISFRSWRQAGNSDEKAQFEQNVVYYAGVLGHYIGDAAEPLHATIHYNGWSTALNPAGFTREPLHGRFEEAFVKARIKEEDVRPLVRTAQRVMDPFSAIMSLVLDSHGQVETLYRLEKLSPWNAANQSAEARQFALQRLALAAQLLADLWYTAALD